MGGAFRTARWLLTPAATLGLVLGGFSATAASATVASGGPPVAVKGLHGVTAVSSGIGFFMALLKNGHVDTWGNNARGQLGDGTTVGSATPVQVKGLSSVKAISAGGFDALALLANGTVMAWGANDVGQLGHPGAPNHSTVPVLVTHLSGVTAISAGLSHNLALLRNGSVLAWGDDVDGELGNRAFDTFSAVPVAVQGLKAVTAISAGNSFSLALLRDGTVRSWGVNTDGQLGTGSTRRSMSDLPVAVRDLRDVQAISAGGFSSLALLPGGQVKSWGDDEVGELGDGTISALSASPVPVRGLTTATAVVSAESYDVESAFSLALLRGGTLADWGATSPASAVPQPVHGVSGVAALSSALLLLRNGTVKVFEVNPTG
jgi:alpha-tubulin suppressor-like RCC1 family protein